MKKLCLMLVLFIGFQSGNAQGLSKIEERIQLKQKWTVLLVKSKRPYWEIGEVLTMRIDRKFYHSRNNYAKIGGEWILNGNSLILTYDSFTEERRRIPYEYKVKKWGNDGWQLAYRNKYNKKERVYLK